MTTAKQHATSLWAEWIESRAQAQDATAVETDSHERAYERAQAVLYNVLKPHEPRDMNIAQPPLQNDVARVLAVLKRFASDKNMRLDRVRHRQECELAIKEIEAAEQHVKQLGDALDALREEKEAAEEALKQVEADMPPPSAKALKEIDGEIEALNLRADKVNDTISAIKDEGSIVSELENEAKTAAAELERLEAEALMGDVEASQKSSAVKKLDEARKNADQAREKAAKQSAARRGLEAMLAEVDTKLQDMIEIRRHVAIEVAKADQAKAESDLLKLVNADQIRPILDRINAARGEINANADDGTYYATARIKIKMPELYATATNETLEL